MIKTLVKGTNGVLLCLNFAAIILDHCVAFVLETLILSLGLDQLTLELFKLFDVATLASKRLGKISFDGLARSTLLQN
jgi:hypothetical protein